MNNISPGHRPQSLQNRLKTVPLQSLAVRFSTATLKHSTSCSVLKRVHQRRILLSILRTPSNATIDPARTEQNREKEVEAPMTELVIDALDELRDQLGAEKVPPSLSVPQNHGRDENFPQVRPPLAV